MKFKFGDKVRIKDGFYGKLNFGVIGDYYTEEIEQGFPDPTYEIEVTYFVAVYDEDSNFTSTKEYKEKQLAKWKD